jgi:hypothetical protein
MQKELNPQARQGLCMQVWIQQTAENKKILHMQMTGISDIK